MKKILQIPLLLVIVSLVVITPRLGQSQEVRRNLIVDPSFETGNENWKRRDDGSSFVESNTRTGTHSLRIACNFDGCKAEGMHDVTQSNVGPILAGQEYIFSAWVRANKVSGIGTGGKPIAALQWRDAHGKQIGRSHYMWAPYGTYDFRQLKMHCEAPEGATHANVHFRTWWDCTGGDIYWDDCSLVERDHPDRGQLLASYQAEEAALISSGKIERSRQGFSGTGYVVATTTDESVIEWKEIRGDGERVFSIRYSLEAGSRTWRLTVNGKDVDIFRPVSTGSPQGWVTASWKARLTQENNTVRLVFRKGVVGPFIDRLDIFEKRNID